MVSIAVLSRARDHRRFADSVQVAEAFGTMIIVAKNGWISWQFDENAGRERRLAGFGGSQQFSSGTPHLQAD
jgi:hypothetical protein